jgi:hypothetical protein
VPIAADRRLRHAVLLLVALATPALANHDEPGRGKSIKGPLVTAYVPCTTPNTHTNGSVQLLGCTPPTRSDPVCGFGASNGVRGMGRVLAVSRGDDVELRIVAKGLGIGCEGRTLCGTVSFRTTTDRCADGPCTVADTLDFTSTRSTACCRVTMGQCKVTTSVNAEVFDAFRPGERAGVELLACGLKRIDGPELPAGRTFSCGLLAP